MTTVAPLPGRETGADDEGDAAAGGHDVVVRPDTPADGTTTATSSPSNPSDPSDPSNTRTVSVAAEAGKGAETTVDLTFHRPKAPSNDPAGQASWVLGLALALLSEGAAERVAMAEVLAESAGRSRAIEGAYGRAVALLSEYPSDPLVHRTVDLLAKTLLRSRRPARAEEA